MAKRKKAMRPRLDGVQDSQLNEIHQLIEKAIIISLAKQGFSYQTIRRIVGCDINRLTSFLKPINKEIRKLKVINYVK